MNQELRKWIIACIKSVKSLHKRFVENKGLILTEGDLQCELFYELKLNQVFNGYKETIDPHEKSGFIHSEVTWFKPSEMNKIIDEITDKENSKSKKSWSEVDISIMHPKNIYTHRLAVNKGYLHDGMIIGIELKFIRITDKKRAIEKKVLEDLKDIINVKIPAKKELIDNPQSYEFGYNNVKIEDVYFFSIVVCCNSEKFQTAKYYFENYVHELVPESYKNVYPIIFSNEEKDFYSI